MKLGDRVLPFNSFCCKIFPIQDENVVIPRLLCFVVKLV